MKLITTTLGYINFSVLELLFCLMLILAGFRKNGIFDRITHWITTKTTSVRLISFILINVSFFSSMLITNDVALITFVPLTLILLDDIHPFSLIILICLETMAANLGGMLTPIGNPQNLYLFEHYNMSISSFFTHIFPIALISYILIVSFSIIIKNTKIEPKETKIIKASKSIIVKNVVYSLLFIMCILTILRIIPYIVCFAITVTSIFICDHTLFKKVDYKLLLTFIFFFIVSGIIGDTKAVNSIISKNINRHEILTSVFLSQFISNVPTAILLSKFTSKGYLLLQGVNIGGLGTLIASMASLISYGQYCKTKNADKRLYIITFTSISILFLIVLYIITLLM